MFLYILKSIPFGKRYIGTTQHWEKRLKYHNKGANKSTRPYRPYKIIYLQDCRTKKEALKLEKKLKSYKGGEALKILIKSWSGRVGNCTRL